MDWLFNSHGIEFKINAGTRQRPSIFFLSTICSLYHIRLDQYDVGM